LSVKRSFSPVRFAVKSAGFAVSAGFCLPVIAQQAIHFSKPADQSTPETTSSVEHPENHVAPSAFNAPKSLFGNFGSSDTSVMSRGAPPPVFFNPNAAAWQKALQDRKNWTLMTPEEVLGIPTAASMLGIVDPEEARLSPEQRFLKRRDQETQAGATNGPVNSISAASSSIWGNINDSAGVFQNPDNNGLPFMNTRQGVPGQPDDRGAFFNKTAVSRNAPAPNAGTIWASSFQSPPPAAKPTARQLEGMETFRALLDSPPSEQSRPIAQSTVSPNPYPTPSAVTADPFMQPQPLSYSPIGSIPSPLESGISKPTGINPLPGITGNRPPPPKPAPVVKPPPWMSDSPQIGTLPKRQF